MKQSYYIKNLCCANCASKIERDIRKLDGVKQADINFITCKLALEADDAGFERVIEHARKIASKYEPNAVLTKA